MICLTWSETLEHIQNFGTGCKISRKYEIEGGIDSLLDPFVYGKTKRRRDDYIFCSVTFSEGQKSYYYLTEDDSIEVGDLVLVPAGKDNHEAVVKVVDIEYFGEADVPLPVEKTKHIIRKCTDEDVDLPGPE